MSLRLSITLNRRASFEVGPSPLDMQATTKFCILLIVIISSSVYVVPCISRVRFGRSVNQYEARITLVCLGKTVCSQSPPDHMRCMFLLVVNHPTHYCALFLLHCFFSFFASFLARFRCSMPVLAGQVFHASVGQVHVYHTSVGQSAYQQESWTVLSAA